MTRKYHVIDLFSGCGGSAEGFRQAGFSIKAAVEINEIAADSFSKNFPEAVVFGGKFGDIRKIHGTEIMSKAKIRNPDRIIILACPPCQGFSSARRVNQRHDDKRNKLVYQFVRLVKEINPIAFVMENVPGLSGQMGKTIFEESIKRLKRIGYKLIAHDVFKTEDFGIPQKRRRLVMIGTRRTDVDLSFPQQTHGSGLLPYSTVRNIIHDLPVLKAGEKSEKDPLHISARLSEINLKRMEHTPHDGGTRSNWPEDLILKCHRRKGHTDTYTRMKWDEPSPTITGGCTMISKGRFAHPEQNRGISLREAARLQTFRDNFIFSGNSGEKADQIGNAVPVLFAKKIAESLLQSLGTP